MIAITADNRIEYHMIWAQYTCLGSKFEILFFQTPWTCMVNSNTLDVLRVKSKDYNYLWLYCPFFIFRWHAQNAQDDSTWYVFSKNVRCARMVKALWPSPQNRRVKLLGPSPQTEVSKSRGQVLKTSFKALVPSTTYKFVGLKNAVKRCQGSR